MRMQDGKDVRSLGSSRRIPRAAAFGLVMVSMAACGGCPSTYRMQATYDAEAVNAAPQAQPAPSPPHDFFTWGAAHVTARVVQGGSGNRVMVEPNAAYLSSGALRAFVLNAFSEPLTTAARPPVRGGMTVSLEGSGRVVFALRVAQPNFASHPIGGFLLMNPGIASLATMNEQNLQVMELNPSLVDGTFLSSYTPGQSIDLRWSIDQASRTLVLGVYPPGGSAETTSVTFSQAGAGGIQNTPIPKVWLEVSMREVFKGTRLFIDNLTVEELR